MTNKYIALLIEMLTGGIFYFYLEIIYRGYSHFSMIICAGLCLVCVGRLGNFILRQNICMLFKICMIILMSMAVITSLELVTGLIVNCKLKLGVWDYTDMRYNYKGQICAEFTCLWGLLGLICVCVDNLLARHVFAGENKADKSETAL